MIDTKERIIAVAERLFGEKGYEATSLRHIIAEAGVNLAAIHYHFGSKEELLNEILSRFAGPINQRRIELLDELLAEAGGGAVPVERILMAFLAPAGQLASRASLRLMGRLFGEGMMPSLAERHFKPTGKRFAQALRRSLPQLPDEEFLWRIDFMVGAMSHAMLRAGIVTPEPSQRAGPLDLSPGSYGARRLACLVQFLSAGFCAPSAQVEEKVEAV
jgi:AcrR family transcriptional regulator